jgi:hypothetical protein
MIPINQSFEINQFVIMFSNDRRQPKIGTGFDNFAVEKIYMGVHDVHTAIWVLVLIIVLFEFHYIKDLLVYIFMKLYDFFIQHNAEGL